MSIEFNMIAVILLPMVVALVISFLSTPIVKSFAYKLGAIDVPKDERRMHKVPIPRMGGLAIFLGFIISVLLFVEIDDQMKGIPVSYTHLGQSVQSVYSTGCPRKLSQQ